MKNFIKNIIIGLSLVLVGGIIFIIGGSVIYNKHGGFEIDKYEIKSYEVVDSFKDLYIDLETYDVAIKKSNDSNVKAEYSSNEKLTCNFAVIDSVLKVTDIDERKWFEKFFSFTKKTLTIYLPEISYNNLTLKVTTGDVYLNSTAIFNNASFDITTGDIEGSINVENNVSIITTTGDVALASIQTKNISIVGTTGDIELSSVIASDSLNLKTTTGDIELVRCDSKNIEVRASTGDVYMTLLTGKIFNVKTTTGDKIVPENFDNGTCVVNVTTGDVKIKIASN